MNIEVTGQHVDLTDALRERVEKRLRAAAGRMEWTPRQVRVVLRVEKNRRFCEVHTRADGKQLVAKSEGDDMYAVIDSAVGKLAKQNARRKERARARRAA